MSLLSRIFFGRNAEALSSFIGGTSTGVVMPWTAPANIAPLVYSDIYGGMPNDVVTRETAMRVAPIKKGRAVIVASIADLPMPEGVMDGDTFTPEHDAKTSEWLRVGVGSQTPWHRWANTLDDLIFNGFCLWVLQRDTEGNIERGGRLHPNRWAFDQNARAGVAIDGRPVDNPADVMLIVGPDEGVLANGADSIRGWRHMESAWVGRVRNPIPAMVLHEKAGSNIAETEAAEYVATFAANRSSPNGMVAWLPDGIDLEEYGTSDADLFVEGRNASRIDLANHLNLPVTRLDGSPATASLTYSTEGGTRSQLVDDLEYWMAPIEARLSEPDVCPSGKVRRFARTNLIAYPNDPYGATAPSVEGTAPNGQ